MGLFNFRGVVAITLFFAVLACAAPAIQQRATFVDVGPLISAINNLTSLVSRLLNVVDNINQGAGAKIDDLLLALSALLNATLTMALIAATALISKLLGIATDDLARLNDAVHTLLIAVTNLVTRITTPTFAALIQADQNTLNLLKTTITGLITVLTAALSSVVSLVGTTSGTIQADVDAAKTLLQGLGSFINSLRSI